METENIVIHHYSSFQGLRQYIRDLKAKGVSYTLVDRRDVHVFLIMPNGEGTVCKTRTFNISMAKKWALEQNPGSIIAFTKRRGEWLYEESFVTDRWQSPQLPLSQRKSPLTHLVVTKRPLEDAVVEVWEDISLEAQQRFVGGRIEDSRFGIDDEYAINFGEGGKSDPDQKPNLKQIFEGELYDIIVGSVVVLKINEHGRTIGLTEAESRSATALLNRMAVSPAEFPRFESTLSQFR